MVISASLAGYALFQLITRFINNGAWSLVSVFCNFSFDLTRSLSLSTFFFRLPAHLNRIHFRYRPPSPHPLCALFLSCRFFLRIWSPKAFVFLSPTMSILLGAIFTRLLWQMYTPNTDQPSLSRFVLVALPPTFFARFTVRSVIFNFIKPWLWNRSMNVVSWPGSATSVLNLPTSSFLDGLTAGTCPMLNFGSSVSSSSFYFDFTWLSHCSLCVLVSLFALCLTFKRIDKEQTRCRSFSAYFSFCMHMVLKLTFLSLSFHLPFQIARSFFSYENYTPSLFSLCF